MLEQITFITIGQTPRTDLVPGIVSHLPSSLEVRELGALDGLSDEEIAGLEPGPDDHALITRLQGGGQTVVGKRWVTGRIQELLDRGSKGSDLASWAEATVLLCTGDFSQLRTTGLFLDSQLLVDSGVEAICHGARSVGLLVPLSRQEEEHHYRPRQGQRIRTTHASPYGDDDFEAAGRRLDDCDVIVMHCMGFTEEQRDAVAAGSGRPVLLARRFVASALAQLL